MPVLSDPFASLFSSTAEFARLEEGLSGPGVTALFGLPPAGRMALAVQLSRRLGRPLCVVTAGEAEASRAAADLQALGLSAAVFPARDLLLRPIEGAGREYEYRRLAVLGGLVGSRVDAVCVPAEGLLQFTVPKAEFCANTLTLKPGMEIPQKQLAARLFGAGYVRRDRVEGPGQFSVRGGILDLYPPDRDAPARLEFWGDEIDTIHAFDLLTQRRGDALEKVYLSPAREVLFGDAAATAQALRDWLNGFKGKKKAALAAAMAPELEQLDAGLVPENLDKYLPVRYPHPATLLDYFEDPLLILEAPGDIAEAQRATRFRRQEEQKGLLEAGVLAPGLDGYYLDLDWLYVQAGRCRTLVGDNFTRSLPDLKLKALVDVSCHALPSWNGEVPALLEDLEPLLKQGYCAAVLAGTQRAADGLAKDLANRGLKATANPQVLPSPGTVWVLPGHLTSGVQFPFARLALITGRRQGTSGDKAKQKAKKNKDALASLSDIQPGDYVVHQNHGIGVYKGIQRLEVQGVHKDYLTIQYDKGDSLFVPVTQLDLLSRYTAPGDEEKVKLSRLGSDVWVRTRTRVKKATEAIAQELVQLYARRRQARGFAFPEDNDWQRDFETRFDYDETDDQLTAAAEIKKDMEQPWPMDRLLCGDVGVGKTEVALRAAFKCVMGGKQCAILAPTTLLAWQHYNTALARMEPFQFRIGLLSRFRSAKQQKADLADLAKGSMDVIVGTHRLLSSDVHFKDLGLVIIDEEQRFGVRHKEKLKEAFVGVDMLTLSATPIPRTLNMAMSGIRDMSTIEEPPEDRLPVQTFVMEHDWGIVADAIRREIQRGGQVYYLHNRVEDIERTAKKLADLLEGEVSIGVAHGKMDKNMLASVMDSVSSGETQVLVCTTIIETGIDIPNVNTLIIEDADHLGLAQLHQIRGRVGRSTRRASAYLTFRRDKVLTEIAEKRLNAIRDFAQFGSGFKIAMRDLEIRGAGNLLGAEQSGHMIDVGYDMYMKLLSEAVLEARGIPVPQRADCSADLAVAANIPDRYIPSSEQRMDIYRRIALIRTEAEADDLTDELIDRFGDPPPGVNALIHVALLRGEAGKAGITDISQKQGYLRFTVEDFNMEKVSALYAMPEYKGRLRVEAGSKPCLSLRIKNKNRVIDEARRFTALWAGEQIAN